VVKVTGVSSPLLPESLALADLLLRHTLLDAPTSLTTRNQDFKTDLKAFYDCSMGNQTRCMLLDTGLPSSVVIGSHLFRRSNEHIASKLMQITDIDDVRNGLLLFKPLEKAFDHFIISFIYDSPSDEFRLKVVNRNYRNAFLVDELTEKERNTLVGANVTLQWRTSSTPIYAINTNFNILTTYGDLDGQPLVFKNINRPFKRCLNLQARLARMKALEEKLADEYDFEDFWSEGLSIAEKLERCFGQE
jgi:hypothetical protein